mgnify:CR=1 FL=1
MSRIDKRIIMVIIFIILGTAIALQFRSTLAANRQKASAAVDVEKLKKQLNDERNVGKGLKDQINELEKKKEESLKQDVNSTGSEYLKKQKEILDYVKLISGMTDVKGPGIIIKLNDALLKKNEMQDANYFIIHDSDIIKIVNELKKAGAQAISINDERIVSISEQVCAGPTIRINRNRHPVPFEIKAIGDPDAMYRAVDKSDRMAILRGLKIRVEMTRSKEILISKFNSNIENFITGLEVTN